MFLFHFYKIAGLWYMNDPTYLEGGGDASLLDVVGGMHDLLEFMAQGHSAVQLMTDTKPFKEADKLVLVETTGGDSGGYYKLCSLKGGVMEQDIWLNELVYYYFHELPPMIYVKFL